MTSPFSVSFSSQVPNFAPASERPAERAHDPFPALADALAPERPAPRAADPSPHAADITRYATYVQTQWAKSVVCNFVRDPGPAVYLLTGSAGCGKSAAIALVVRMMAAANRASLVCVGASTHAAAAVLREARVDSAQTFHSMLGLSIGMCRAADARRFSAMYRQKHGRAIEEWAALMRDPLACVLLGQHGCATVSLRCARCMSAARRRVSEAARCALPEFAGRGLLFFDEYGMMGSEDFDKILLCASYFAVPGHKYHLVFSGSVSQLTVPERVPVWKNPLFREALGHKCALLLSHRQARDPAYARSLTMMQFNTVTREAASLFDSRVVGSHAADDPNVLPGVTRIYNANDRKNAYNDRVATQEPAQLLGLSVDHATHSPSAADDEREAPPCSFADYSKALADAHPKIPLFNARRLVKSFNVRAESPLMLYGCRGGRRRVVATGYDPRTDRLAVRPAGAAPDPPGERGEQQFVERAVFKQGGRATAFFPVAPVAAINAFCAQGTTLPSVVYCPPERCYMMSSIKSAAYVAMSRVSRSEDLWLSANPFREPGRHCFFPEDALRYRKTVELGYE